MELVYRINEINEAAQKVWQQINGNHVVVFDGPMGAGKTTFIQAICRQTGVKDTMSSPTFSIINEYESEQGSVYHIDLYRCKNEEEAIRAGVEDCLYSGNLCFVEWPSKARGIFPPETIHIGISEIDVQTRKISVNKTNLYSKPKFIHVSSKTPNKYVVQL